MEVTKISRYVRTLSKVGLKSLVFFIDLWLIYFLAVFIGESITINKNFKQSTDGMEVYLISNGVHLDICLPLDSSWKAFIPPSDFQTGNYNFISFGWGEENFYLKTPTWNDLTLQTALYGALVPSPTAMHVTYYRRSPRISQWVARISISIDQYTILCQEIRKSFKLTNNQSPILIDCCRYPGVNDNFYKARGSYHLFNTCNEWVNQTLKKSKIKAFGWAPFDQSLLRLYD